MTTKNGLASQTDCGVCDRPLVYGVESMTLVCSLCGREEVGLIHCPAGHFICDDCHSKAALEVLSQVLATTHSIDPTAILEQVMAHPSVTMHGPEHHVIVPAAIVAAVVNAGFPVPEDALQKVVERARKVPGGWCGSYGTCGAAVGIGIAVSVLTGATPLKGTERSLALAATSLALSRMPDDQPRCCKRASRRAVESSVDFLRERLGIDLGSVKTASCTYALRNAQCPREWCPYFDPAEY